MRWNSSIREAIAFSLQDLNRAVNDISSFVISIRSKAWQHITTKTSINSSPFQQSDSCPRKLMLALLILCYHLPQLVCGAGDRWNNMSSYYFWYIGFTMITSNLILLTMETCPLLHTPIIFFLVAILVTMPF